MWTVIATCVVALIGYFYYWNTRHYGTFAKHGIFEPPKSFPFGSDPNWNVMTGKKHFFKALEDVYSKYGKQHKAMGLYANSVPVLMVNDLDWAKNILVKDFSHFADRRPVTVDRSTEANQLISNMMVALHGEKWRKVRSLMSPIFTSGKLKIMTPLINKVGIELGDYLEELANTNEEFSTKEVLVSYTLDCIASCGFGVETNSFKNPDGIFKKMVLRLADGGPGNKMFVFKFFLVSIAPDLMKLLKLDVIDGRTIRFLNDIVRSTVKQRKESNIKRGDLIDLCLKALEESDTNANKKNGQEQDQFEKDAEVKSSYKISPDEIETLLVANLIVLFIAGFDTTSTAVSLAMGFLAKHPDIQEKLHQEILETYEFHGTKNLDYNAIQDMAYLEMVFLEVLRYYFVFMIERVCTKDYPLPGTNFVVPKGMIVQVPGSSYHKEKKYYPDADHFNPEKNWSPEARAARTPYSFLTFGQGPRNCIGMRFALLMGKMALVRIVGNFRVLEGPSMPKEFVMSPTAFTGTPTGGVWCKLERRRAL